MKKSVQKLFQYFIIILFLLSIAISVYFFIDRRNLENKINYWEDIKLEKLNFVSNLNQDDTKSELEQMRAVQKQEKSIDEVFVTGWIPDWDFKDGKNSLMASGNAFDSVSPFWFEANSDGSLTSKAVANNQELIDYTTENNIELIPTVTCFEALTLSQILNDPDNMNRHVESIIAQVVNNGYDGIDLDYESVYLKDKDLFFEFLQKLSVELIENDKKFVFTALAKWGDRDVVYLGFPETKKTFDYKRIADMVDEFRIMTYEYSGKTNKYYGPIAPIDWQEDVIRYAIYAGVPREKIVLGVPTFSYDYLEREKLPAIEYYPVFKTETDSSLPAALAYYNVTIDELINNYDMQVEFEEEWGEAIGRYTDDEGNSRVVVFPNQRSIDLRKQLAADYGIKGVAYWRIGDEGSLKY